MTNKLKIRCLFGQEDGADKWGLLEALPYYAWADGADFEKQLWVSNHYDLRELTIEVDDDRVQELLGASEVVEGVPVEDQP